MSCPNYDWKSYALGEMDRTARQEAEAHAATCPACREEVATLRLTLDTLSTLRDEEIPRRIAFVSDKVFEPRWWQRWLTPNFAAACVIAAAILVHAFSQPSESAALSQARIDAAVSKAVVQVEAQHSAQIERMLADYDNRNADVFKLATGLERQ
jgi:anti-sigma factor RsiW